MHKMLNNKGNWAELFHNQLLHSNTSETLQGVQQTHSGLSLCIVSVTLMHVNLDF